MMSPKSKRILQSGSNKNKFTMKHPQVEDIDEHQTDEVSIYVYYIMLYTFEVRREYDTLIVNNII